MTISDLMRRLPHHEFPEHMQFLGGWGTHYTQHPTTAGNLKQLCVIWENMPWGWHDETPYPVKNIMALLSNQLRSVQAEPFHQEWSCSWNTSFNSWYFSNELPLIMHDAWVTHLYRCTKQDADLAFNIIVLDRQLRIQMEGGFNYAWGHALLAAQLITREEFAEAQ